MSQPGPPTYRVVMPPPPIRVLLDGAILATPEQRLGARAIDGGVAVALMLAVVLPLYSGDLAGIVQGHMPADMRPMVMVGFAAAVVYEGLMLTWKRATLGKLVLKIEVRRVGEPRLTPTDILRREVLPALIVVLWVYMGSAFYLHLLDPVWLLFDQCRQALHDKIAGTVVVGRGAYAPGARPETV